MAVFIVTNTNDSGAGSLRQAILDSNATGGSNQIEFDSSLLSQTITILSILPISTNAVIDGDIDNDSINGDITIMMDQNNSLFTLDTIGLTFEQSADIDFDIDDAVGFPSTRGAVLVEADDASFINHGTINTAGIETSTGDRMSSIQVLGDNFTLNNNADGSIVSAGRSAIEAFRFDDVTFEVIDTFTTVVNAGLLEAADDTIRLTNGLITNTGTIRTAGTFDFGGILDTPGQIADTILFFGPQSENYAGGPNQVDNSASGLIEGARSAVFFNGGDATLQNDGMITAEVTAVVAQGTAFFDDNSDPVDALFEQNFIIENTGTIIRTGENYGFNNFETHAAIVAFGRLDSFVVTNSGLIQSTDIAINAVGIGGTLNNEANGTIVSDSDGFDADGIGEDGVAYRGAQLDDFEIEATISFPGVGPNQVFENAQGITIDSNGDFVIPGIGTFATVSGQVEAAFIPGVDNSLLPLVDITATQNTGVLTFQTDANGTVYPATIDIVSSTLGTITVNWVSGAGFTITAVNGNPVFDVPQGVDYSDTIDNQGTINGDIVTGLDDDSVTNTGVIDGDISLGLGNDTFTSLGANGGLDLTVDGGAGNDVIQSGDNNDVLNGEAGDDILSGGAGNDNLAGEAGNDTLNGDADNDTIDGGNGEDIIDGGAGNDTLRGGGGNDMIDGGVGLDTLSGGIGNDTVHGGGNNDTILGQGGADILFGDGGTDTLRGGSGNDTLHGGDARDLLFGQGNNDILYGEGGNDSLSGAAGSDQLFGGDGNDTLNGSIGADRLDGGAGNDVLHGGGADGARDTFVFAEGYEQDRINSFDQAGNDRIELDDALWAAAGTLTSQEVVDMFGSLNGTGSILTLDFGNGDILEVQNGAGIDMDTFGADILVI